MNIAILASGRGSNLQAIIEAAESGEITGCLKIVVSNVSGAYALERGKKHGIESVLLEDIFDLREEYDKALIKILEDRGVDLICLAGFMRILTPLFVKHFKNRIINIHPSLLPAFKGMHAQQQAIDYGVRYSGCTVHFVDEGVDSGPVILQAAVPVKQDDTGERLSERILEKEHIIYPEAVELFVQGRLKVKGRKVKILDA